MCNLSAPALLSSVRAPSKCPRRTVFAVQEGPSGKHCPYAAPCAMCSQQPCMPLSRILSGYRLLTFLSRPTHSPTLKEKWVRTPSALFTGRCLIRSSRFVGLQVTRQGVLQDEEQVASSSPRLRQLLPGAARAAAGRAGGVLGALKTSIYRRFDALKTVLYQCGRLRSVPDLA